MKIAFGGKARSGKTTAQTYLTEKYTGQKLNFADGLYDILHFAQGVCNFPQEKDREFLQYIGTDWARKKDEDVWCNLLEKRVEESSNENIFIGDVRFVNEFKMLKNRGFVMVLLEGSGDTSSFGSGSKTHSSEMDLENVPVTEWDYIIKNNYNDEFYKTLDEIVVESTHNRV